MKRLPTYNGYKLSAADMEILRAINKDLLLSGQPMLTIEKFWRWLYKSA